METPKHTPGPWMAFDGQLDGFDGEWDVVGSDLCGIASMAGTAEKAKFPRDKEANAHLIAAAPEMLAMLRKMRDRLIGSAAVVQNRKGFWAEVDAVIAKAEGKAIYDESGLQI